MVEAAEPTGLVLRVLTSGIRWDGVRPGTLLTLFRHGRFDAYTGNVRMRELALGPPVLLLTDVPVGVERRAHRDLYRVDVDLPADGEDWAGRVRNLSGSGCLLVIAEASTLVPGTGVDLQIGLPPPHGPLLVSGEVARTPERPPGAVGVEFLGLTRGQQDNLVRYVTRRQAELLRKGMLLE